MSWIIEGKVSQLTFEPSKALTISIKALSNYQVKHGDVFYNVFINNIPPKNSKSSIKALLYDVKEEFTIDAQYGVILNSMRDNAITFVFKNTNNRPSSLESLTVKYQ